MKKPYSFSQALIFVLIVVGCSEQKKIPENHNSTSFLGAVSTFSATNDVEVLKNELIKNPDEVELNYLIGKYYQNKKLFRVPFMSKYYYQYITVTDSIRENPSEVDDAILNLTGYYILLSGRYGTPKYVLEDNLEGRDTSIDVNKYLAKVSNKKNQEYLLLNGLFKIITHDYDSAIKELDQVDVSNLDYSKSKWVYNNLGFALIKAGNYKEAVSALRIAVFIDPNNKFAHANYGCALFNINHFKEALTEYRKALVIDATYSTAINGIEECKKVLKRN